MATDMRHISSSKSIGRIAANVAGVKNQTMEYIEDLSPAELEELKKSFKAAKSRHRLQRLKDKKLMQEEYAQHHKKNQEKQRKKKKKGEDEANFDKYIGQQFIEKWGDPEVLYNGIITKKQG
uniref:Uncharacterized protein n=1 Tax=Panagrolaimus sp. ES5 TaxID=591445 RepID=A0AC34FUE0_9BILA